MNIFGIMMIAKKEGSWIRRKGWPKGHAIIPTDNPETAMVMITPTKVQPRWDLRASDLLATDWGVVETEYRITEGKND